MLDLGTLGSFPLDYRHNNAKISPYTSLARPSLSGAQGGDIFPRVYAFQESIAHRLTCKFRL